MTDTIGLNIEVTHPEDVKKIAARATEILNILNPKDEENIVLSEYENGICFSEMSKGLRPIIVWIVAECIAVSFPEMELTVYTTLGGVIETKHESEGGILVSIEPITDEDNNPLRDDAGNMLFL